MSETASPTPALEAPALTIWTALRRPEQWWQLIQFGLVGSSGFVVNFAVYAVCLKGFGLHYIASALHRLLRRGREQLPAEPAVDVPQAPRHAARGRAGRALPGRLGLRARARTC